MPNYITLGTLTLIVAFLYASVGHGGASGYLAILSFCALPRDQMGSSALMLNLLVAGISFWIFWKSGHFSWRLTWPFVMASIPAAYCGGFFEISTHVYAFLLIGVLLFSAAHLFFERQSSSTELFSNPPILMALVSGGGIGFLSGLIGVGGGIFLSPLLLLLGWAGPKQTAATSAFFIWVNSLAALMGRSFRDGLDFPPFLILMVFVAFLGSQYGACMGACRFSGVLVKRVLGLVLILAVVKLWRVL